MPEETEEVTFYIDIDMLKQLEEIAKEQKITLNDLINNIMESHIKYKKFANEKKSTEK